LAVGLITQEPWVQTSEGCGQLKQGAPLRPHSAAEVPGLHWLPWQQPVQLLGPQELRDWQLPLVASQVCPWSAQLRQPIPPLPHWVLVGLVTQVVPLQQPVQLLGVQVPVPPSQTPVLVLQVLEEELQSMQLPPLMPHLASVRLVTQVLPLQQPLQLLELQVVEEVLQVPADASQMSPLVVQSTHLAPDLPQ